MNISNQRSSAYFVLKWQNAKFILNSRYRNFDLYKQLAGGNGCFLTITNSLLVEMRCFDHYQQFAGGNGYGLIMTNSLLVEMGAFDHYKQFAGRNRCVFFPLIINYKTESI